MRLIPAMISVFAAAICGFVILPAENLIVYDFAISTTTFRLLSLGFSIASLIGFILARWTGRLLGKRREMIALGALLATTLLCAVAWDFPSLLGFRTLQGLSGAVVIALGFAMVANEYPIGKRAGLLGLFLVVLMTGGVTGPLLGALIVDNLGWRWCFFVILPIAAIGLILHYLSRPLKH